MASTALESTTDSLSKLGIHADFAASVPNLQKNLRLLSAEQVRLRVCMNGVVECDFGDFVGFDWEWWRCGRLSWRGCCWRWGRVTCSRIGLSLASMTRKRKVFLSRCGFFFFFFFFFFFSGLLMVLEFWIGWRFRFFFMWFVLISFFCSVSVWWI
jgi:hypothetical protein